MREFKSHRKTVVKVVFSELQPYVRLRPGNYHDEGDIIYAGGYVKLDDDEIFYYIPEYDYFCDIKHIQALDTEEITVEFTL